MNRVALEEEIFMNMVLKSVKTPRGVFYIYEQFRDRKSAEQAGYNFLHSCEGFSIYVKYFDLQNPYRCHFGLVVE